MKKTIFIAMIMACTLACKKNIDSLAEESPKELSKNVAKNVKSFTDFLDRKKELANDSRSSNYISEYQVLPIGVDQYVETLDSYSNEQYHQVYGVVNQTPVSEELLQYDLDPNSTPEQAVYEIKSSLSSVLNINNFADQIPYDNYAVSQNLEVLQDNIISIANDELDKAILLDENSIDEGDVASTEVENRLRNRIITSINDHVSYTNYNLALTSQQKTSIAVSALYAMETLHTDNLMQNIGAAVRSSLDSVVQEQLQHYRDRVTDGLFSKIGKFIKKVVKSVAVVAWSAVVIVGSVIVATIMDDKNTPDMVTNTRAGLGLLAGVSYVASHSKKWWRWALS